MVKIFLLRHGECWSNRNNIVEGGLSDSKLTPEGIKQAKKLALALKKEDINAIYSSPLKRTLETAKIIAAQQKINVIDSNELREINFGNLEGKSWSSVYKTIPNWKEIRHKYKPKKGESQEELEERVLIFLNKIISKHKKDTIIIVGHGSVNRAIIGNLLKIDLKSRYSLRQSNGCLNLIEISDNKVIIHKTNDISHLN